jgi:hypothetical protein
MRSARAAILAAKAYSQDDNSGRNTGSPTKSTALSKEAAKAALCELKDAMPLSKYQGEQAVILIQQLNTTDLELCELGAPKRPILPPNYLTSQWEKIPINERLLALQKYISGFEYNFTNKQYFNVMKNRPLARVMDTAKEIMRRSLPIKCLEAVFLGIYLTAGMTELDRIPVGFKTAVSSHEPTLKFTLTTDSSLQNGNFVYAYFAHEERMGGPLVLGCPESFSYYSLSHYCAPRIHPLTHPRLDRAFRQGLLGNCWLTARRSLVWSRGVGSLQIANHPRDQKLRGSVIFILHLPRLMTERFR